MSEPKLISPMLDNFVMGDPISEHAGVRSCPAMNETNGDKYIVKIISSPATETQLNALLLTGAYSSKEDALAYYEEIANNVVNEVEILQKLSELEGFMAFDDHQLVPMDDGNGFDVYLLSSYKMSLSKFFRKEAITHLQALNLGLDLCAALAACRRCGYLYVNLKPDNIYLTVDNGFRIGDLGFLKLDTLRYASLPDRYRSSYTAPEVEDAFALLNETMDVYAVGLILYQAFNGGQLPAKTADALVAPDFADYEMAEIILKACDPNPENRWADPAQMGHALVDYMQRNGAHNTPIAPPVVSVPEEEIPENEDAVEVDGIAQETPVEEEVTEQTSDAHESTDEESTVTDSAEEVFTEEDETLPGMHEEDLDLDEVSEEVSDILNQADELLAHPTPDPVVAPEPVEITLPEEEPVADDTADEQVETSESSETDEEAENQQEGNTEEDSDSEKTAGTGAETESDDNEDEDISARPKRRWLRNTIIVAIILALLAGGFAFYKFYYVQNIDVLYCTGEGTSLTVSVTTKADENLLTVICTDTYGNKLEAPVLDGVATFNNLTPNAAYTIKVEISGFHMLTGEVSAAYATPKQTEVTEFAAYTGNESGIAVLLFSVDGPDADLWHVRYTNDSGEEIILDCTDHIATVQDLTLGNEYNFTLYPAEDIDYVGTTSITYTATAPVLALDLYAANITEDSLSLYWSAPANTEVREWIVRCTNNNGYDESVTTSDATTTFSGLIEAGEYTLEVTASGMMTSQRITVDTSAVKISDLAVSTEGNATTLTWSCDSEVNSSWYVEYTIDSNVKQTVNGTTDCSITLPVMIPGARYKFVIGNGDTVFNGNVVVYTAEQNEGFNQYGITKEDVTLKMCYTPSYEEWNRYYLTDEDYSTTFRVGEKASFTVSLSGTYERSRETVVVQVVIRNDMNQVVAISTTENTWRSMWSYGEGSVNLPALPEIPGQYQAAVYFNGRLAGEQTFTVNN